VGLSPVFTWTALDVFRVAWMFSFFSVGCPLSGRTSRRFLPAHINYELPPCVRFALLPFLFFDPGVRRPSAGESSLFPRGGRRNSSNRPCHFPFFSDDEPPGGFHASSQRWWGPLNWKLFPEERTGPRRNRVFSSVCGGVDFILWIFLSDGGALVRMFPFPCSRRSLPPAAHRPAWPRRTFFPRASLRLFFPFSTGLRPLPVATYSPLFFFSLGVLAELVYGPFPCCANLFCCGPKPLFFFPVWLRNGGLFLFFFLLSDDDNTRPPPDPLFLGWGGGPCWGRP